ncbi:MAG TPA: hypothetical protein VF950_02970 [Planctomycetota bacterium]
MSETSYVDPKVIEMSKNFVNVVAHQETTHGDRELLVGREKKKLCTEYFNIPCSVHVKGYEAAGKFFQGTFSTPTTVFADPGGVELSRKVGGLSGGELVKAMNEALLKVNGEKIGLPVWSLMKQLQADVEAQLAKNEAKKAVDAAAKIVKLGKGSVFRDAAKESNDKIAEHGKAALEAALALEKLEDKKKALQKVVDAYKPLPVSDEAKAELAKLK